jgi:hypothetical protein
LKRKSSSLWLIFIRMTWTMLNLCQYAKSHRKLGNEAHWDAWPNQRNSMGYAWPTNEARPTFCNYVEATSSRKH